MKIQTEPMPPLQKIRSRIGGTKRAEEKLLEIIYSS